MAKKQEAVNPASAVVSAYQTQNRARNLGGKLGNLLDANVQRNQALALKNEKEAKVAAKTAEINSWMANLKSDLPLTGLSGQNQTAMKNWLFSKKQEYAYASSQIANIQDQLSPEYMMYSDQLNEINASISNLSDQIKSYKKNRLDFADMNEKDMWSAGNDPESNAQAQTIYGLNDNPVPFTISQDGNLGFNIDGNQINFKDYKSPFMKDYKSAKYITTQANTLFNAHTELSDQKISTLRLGLEEQLADPGSLRSLISSDFTVNGLDFSNIVYNPDDIAGTRKQVIDAIIVGYQDVAKEGVAEYKRKNPGARNENPNPGNVVKNADGTQTYVSPDKKGPVAGDVDSYPDTKQGDYAMRIDQSTDYAINNMEEVTETVKGPDGTDVEQTVKRGIGMPFKIKGIEFTPIYKAIEGENINKTLAEYTFIHPEKGENVTFTYDQMMQFAKGA